MADQPESNQPDVPFGLELQILVTRAQQGDQSVLPELRQFLDDHPEVWQQVGDLSQMTESAWIALVAGEDLFAAESLKRYLAQLKADLKPESPLEKLLVDRIALCSMTADYADAAVVQCKDASLAQAKFLLQRQVAMNQRLLAATKALATVRALMSQAERNKARTATSGKPTFKVHTGEAGAA